MAGRMGCRPRSSRCSGRVSTRTHQRCSCTRCAIQDFTWRRRITITCSCSPREACCRPGRSRRTVMLLISAMRRTLRAARIEARGYWVRAGAAVGLMAIAFQELVEFSLQIPANAFLFCTLAAFALHAGSVDARRPAQSCVITSTCQRTPSVSHCPKCHSTNLRRSPTRNWWERWRKEITGKRPYRCRTCQLAWVEVFRPRRRRTEFAAVQSGRSRPTRISREPPLHVPTHASTWT